MTTVCRNTRRLALVNLLALALGFWACAVVHAVPVEFEGPDGWKVPNVTFAGVPGGIPDVPVAVRLEDFGGRAETDVSDALERAAAAAEGKGAVLIGEGTFYLDRPVLIASSGVVLRGAGMDKTRLVFRWEPARDSVDFIGLRDGDVIPPQKTIYAAAWNDSRDNEVVQCLKRLAIEINGRVAAEQTGGEGPWFCISPDNRKSQPMLQPGENTLRAIAEYADGRSAEKVVKVTVSKAADLIGASPRDAAIHFAEPSGMAQSDWAVVEDGTSIERGSNVLSLQRPVSWEPGDVVMVAFHEGWEFPVLTIEENQGDVLVFREPFRFGFTLKSLRRLAVLRGCGVEDLTLEQTSGHWTHLVAFTRDVGCWMRRVKLVNAGRFPVAGMMKNFEIRDCEASGTQFHFGVGGGAGYLAFSGSIDSLMENVRTEKLRHAPTFQHGAQGCVIRASVFEDSDAQFHRGRTWDNLLENCTVNSVGSNQSYGSYGPAVTVTTSPESGDVGAGNVIFNNTFTCRNFYKGGTAFWLRCGSSHGWIVAYNSFESDIGHAITVDGPGHDMLFLRNVFSVAQPEAPAVKGEAAPLRLRENVFLGFSEQEILPVGAMPVEFSGNIAETPAARFDAPVPSLFQWQKARR